MLKQTQLMSVGAQAAPLGAVQLPLPAQQGCVDEHC
jgi:hypothetical protein